VTDRCCGCGAEAPNSQWVAVIKELGSDCFVHRAICQMCYVQPARRPGLKAHFFPRPYGAVAAQAAGATQGITA
jgi:hypothetical protein